MLTIRILFLLAGLLTVQPVFSQCSEEISGCAIIVRKKEMRSFTDSQRHKQLEKIAETKICLKTSNDVGFKARMSFLISNRYFYLDSFNLASKYLQNSFSIDSTWFCKNLDYHYRTVECNKYVQDHIGSFFMMEMDEIDEYFTQCQTDTTHLKEKAAEAELRNSQKVIPDYLQEVYEKDQIERRKEIVDWTYQRILDEENRNQLDQMFLEGTLEFTNESLDIVWFIVQHSTDCKWTMKWFEILLDKVDSKQFKGNYLKFTFERFFNRNTGYCLDQCGLESQVYIKRIREKFKDNEYILNIIAE